MSLQARMRACAREQVAVRCKGGCRQGCWNKGWDGGLDEGVVMLMGVAPLTWTRSASADCALAFISAASAACAAPATSAACIGGAHVHVDVGVGVGMATSTCAAQGMCAEVCGSFTRALARRMPTSSTALARASSAFCARAGG